MSDLPETILQFGGGRFLRGFADLFVQQANDAGQSVGQVVVVQSTDSERARLLNAQNGRYHVLIRGREDGQTIDRVERVTCISRALIAQTEWQTVLSVGRSPDLRTIFSNTTEAGLVLDPQDAPDAAPPRSFPAKLLRVLEARFESGLPGVTILPCELLEGNADRLRALVGEQAQAWRLTEAFIGWLEAECVWLNNLVDRIVVEKIGALPPFLPKIEGPEGVLTDDRLLTIAEPFALWAIEEQPGRTNLFSHPAIQVVPDVKPYHLRKVRILNGAHTALVNKAMPRGFTTVKEAVADPEIRDWLHHLLFDEIVPTLEGRVEEPETFARQTLERFANPFLEHQLKDIAVYHEVKVKIRLLPTREEYVAKFGRAPRYLDEALSEGVGCRV